MCTERGKLCGIHSLLSLSQLLHLVGFSLSRSLHSGDELLVSSSDLLLLNRDLLLPLHHLNFYLLQTDLLLLFGCLQLIRQLSLCFLEKAGDLIYTPLSLSLLAEDIFRCSYYTFVFTSWLKDAFCISSSRLESAIFVSAKNLTSIISFLHSASCERQCAKGNDREMDQEQSVGFLM